MQSHANEIAKIMTRIGINARQAASDLAMISTEAKNKALIMMSNSIMDMHKDIINANSEDLISAKKRGANEAIIDRLMLDKSRIEEIAKSIEDISELPDPIGKVIASWQRPNGLNISRVMVPIGVIGIIYESRPNVTADAGALCLKSGNAVILRGGSNSFHSSMAIFNAIQEGLKASDVHQNAIQIVPSINRQAVGEILSGLSGNIDIVVPRGGKNLVARVQKEAKVPVLSHLDGICHVYIDKDANLNMAVEITVNSKMRRTGICGAMETLLIDKRIAAQYSKPILNALIAKGCEIRGETNLKEYFTNIKNADMEDWHTEYLDSIISVKIVDGVEEAIRHINKFGSGHTDAIITDNQDTAKKFLHEVNSAITMHNCSTQFADGGEFGMGAEIGIATGKIHARGPVGLEQLTIFKYQVEGSGQVRE